MKIKEGKTFIEIEDNHGWNTRVNIRKSDLNIEIIQSSGKIRRYVNFNGKESKLILNKIKEIYHLAQRLEEECEVGK